MRPLDGMACARRAPIARHLMRWRRLVSDASAGRRTAHTDSITVALASGKLILSLCSELDPAFSMWVAMNRPLRRGPVERVTISGRAQGIVRTPGRLRGRMGLSGTPLYMSTATLGDTRWAITSDAADLRRKSR